MLPGVMGLLSSIEVLKIILGMDSGVLS